MNYTRLYLIFIVSLVGLLIVNHWFTNYSFDQEQESRNVINHAQKQGLLSQQIAKISLQILQNETNQVPSAIERTDLKNTLNNWKSGHNTLINGNRDLDIPVIKSKKIDALLKEIQPVFDIIYENGLELIPEKKLDDIQLHTKAILNKESPFLVQMTSLITAYNTEQTRKININQRIGFWLTLLTILIISLELIYLLDPIYKSLTAKNQAFTKEIADLTNKNREMDVHKTNVDSKNKQLQRQNEILAENNSDLLEAKDNAVELSKVKTDFLSNMSHEIRTPLNAIIGVTNLLAEENPKPDQVEHLDTLLFSAENLMVIINDILDYSKIGAGKIKFEKINFSIQRILKGIYKTILPSTQKKSIELKYEIAENVPQVLIGDPVRISQILINLVSNAVKFTEKGTVKFEVKLLKSTPEKVHLSFAVIDTGIGIAEDKQELIFESFSQANSKTTRLYGGTGLGLAITKQLLELQGSQIQLTSKVGKGSTFFFDLVLPIGAAPSTDAAARIAAKSAELVFNTSTKVLLVDDNAINILIAKRFLTKWKLDVDVAKNGREAVDMVKVTDYGLVLMDINMPEMDGYEATRIIRTWEASKYQLLPIVALTASVFDALKYQAIEAGMNDYLSKPFKPQELYDMIKKYIQA